MKAVSNLGSKTLSLIVLMGVSPISLGQGYTLNQASSSRIRAYPGRNDLQKGGYYSHKDAAGNPLVEWPRTAPASGSSESGYSRVSEGVDEYGGRTFRATGAYDTSKFGKNSDGSLYLRTSEPESPSFSMHGGFLGVVMEVAPYGRNIEGWSHRNIILVKEVLPNSPAEEAGLLPGDVLWERDFGDRIVSAEVLGQIINRYRDGDQFEFTILRDGERIEKIATLVSRRTYMKRKVSN